MKKILALFFCAIAFMVLVACGKAEKNTVAPPATTQATQNSRTEQETTKQTTGTTATTASTAAPYVKEEKDENGKVIAKNYYDGSDKITKRETFYENGLLKEKMLYNEHGAAERYELSLYDENGVFVGKNIEIGIYNRTGVVLEKKYEQKYNANAVLLEETVYTLTEKGVAAFGNVTKYNENGVKTYTGVVYFSPPSASGTYFDENGEVTAKEKVEYASDGTLTYLSKSEYAPGFIIKKKIEQKLNSGTFVSHEYFYDADGKLKESRETLLYISTQISNAFYYTYYKSNGDVATKYSLDENGEIAFYESFKEEGGRICEVRSTVRDGKQYWVYSVYGASSQKEAVFYYLKEDKQIYETVKYYYYENGRIKRIETLNAEGEVISYTEYDKYGKISAKFPE